MRKWALLVGVLTAAVLILAVKSQIFDTNFYSLWEATALLAGDHPYRDFFEWGIPLQALLSAAVQWLVGYRLIGEFATQWLFIIAGSVIAFVLGVRLSRSTAASMATALVALPIVANAPTYHYPKLFFYPLALWMAWRYMDAPSPRRAGALGLLTAVAFLFRHDHLAYLGFVSLLAFGLARAGGGSARPVRLAVGDATAYAGAAAVLVVPWLVVVQRSEGVIEYAQTRIALFRGDSAANPFGALFEMHPIRLIRSDLLAPGPETTEHAAVWVEQMAMLVPLALLVSVCFGLIAHRFRGRPRPSDARAALLAACFLAVLDFALLREASYAQVVAPLTAALAASFLTWGRVLATAEAEGQAPRHRGWWRVRWVTAVALLLLTAVAAALAIRENSIVQVGETLEDLPKVFSKLVSSPPIDAFVPPDQVRQLTRVEGTTLPLMILVRYVHDCTRNGDRVLVTGSTPFDIGYLIERPIAGGHLFWHRRWRADPEHEAQSLELLRAQSVPFAIATHDPVLEDLKAYPRVYAHVRSRYREVEGSDGHLLVERDRNATGRWSMNLPCFR